MNLDPISTMMLGTIGLVLVALVIVVFARRFVWWWFGIDEQLKEAKRTNELLEQIIAPPPLPVEAPTAEAQPRRNPLTQR